MLKALFQWTWKKLLRCHLYSAVEVSEILALQRQASSATGCKRTVTFMCTVSLHEECKDSSVFA